MKTKNLITALRSMALLGVTGLQANTVWVGSASSADINLNTNWSPQVVPDSSTIVEFNSATSYNSITNGSNFSVQGIVFDAGAPSYYIQNDSSTNPQTFAVGLSGVVNNSGNTQKIANDTEFAPGLITFAGGSIGNNMLYTSYNPTAGVGGITFLGPTDASGTTINLFKYSTLTTNGDCQLGSVNVGAGFEVPSNCSLVTNGPTTIESLTIIEDSNFIMNGDCSVGSLNVGITSSDTSSYIVLQSGTLTIDGGVADIDDYIYGPISGPGTLVFTSNNPTGNDYFGFSTNANTYTGGTVVNAVSPGGVYTFSGATLAPTGPITVNSGNLTFGSDQTTGNLSGAGGSVIIEGSYLNVNQTSNATYAGSISGSSATSFIFGTTGSPSAVGTLQLTGDSSAYTGTVEVNSGNLQVNNNLGANSLTVNSGATLSGTGTFGNLGRTATIGNGGTLSPGNSVGVITNAGNQVFDAGSIFRLEENGYTTGPITPSNDLLIVAGTTTVDAATVDLVTTNNKINFNTKQIFLTSGGGLTINNGGFSLNTSGLTQFNPEAFTSSISYDANNYYILNQTQFSSEVADHGASGSIVAVAAQLDSIIDPNTRQNFFLNDLAQLSSSDLITLLNDMTGTQYAAGAFLAEVSNRQFIRRLYDPLRSIVTSQPCNECCFIDNPCGEWFGLDLWAEVGGGQRRVNGHLGLSLNEWDVTFGLQKTFADFWTVGIAGSYEHNYLGHNYSITGGGGYSWFGGLYGLYRPSNYYVLADIAYGYTQHKIHRDLVFIDATDTFIGRPKISQVTFYAEGGVDANLWYLLAQPFVGIEVAGFYRNSFSERDVDLSDLGLRFHKQDRTLATSSLGVHLTDQYFTSFNVSLDLAWLYQFTKHNLLYANFETFGSAFAVDGKRISRSSGQGAITISKDFYDTARVYVEASGEIWSNASAYNVLGGFQFNW